ncbi:MAG: Alpha-glucoside transport system permease protein AglG, partial [uncultured Pseudonocardia sp.]
DRGQQGSRGRPGHHHPRPGGRAALTLVGGEEGAHLPVGVDRRDRHRGALDHPHPRAAHHLVPARARRPQHRLVDGLHRPVVHPRQLRRGAVRRDDGAVELLRQQHHHHDPGRHHPDRARVDRGVRVRVDVVQGPRLPVRRGVRPADRAAAGRAHPAAGDLRQQRAGRHVLDRVDLPLDLRAAAGDLPAAQLDAGHPGRARRGRPRRRGGPRPHLHPDHAAADEAGHRGVQRVPVPVGVERPARGADLRGRHPRRGAADGPRGRADRHPGGGLLPARRRGVRVDHHPAGRVPVHAALLRPRTAGGQRQGL